MERELDQVTSVDEEAETSTTRPTSAEEEVEVQAKIQEQAVSEERIIQILNQKPVMEHPWPMCCLPKFKPGRKFLYACKRCVYQFVVIKPLIVRAHSCHIP